MMGLELIFCMCIWCEGMVDIYFLKLRIYCLLKRPTFSDCNVPFIINWLTIYVWFHLFFWLTNLMRILLLPRPQKTLTPFTPLLVFVFVLFNFIYFKDHMPLLLFCTMTINLYLLTYLFFLLIFITSCISKFQYRIFLLPREFFFF